jgi:hypothetical protein
MQTPCLRTSSCFYSMFDVPLHGTQSIRKWLWYSRRNNYSSVGSITHIAEQVPVDHRHCDVTRKLDVMVHLWAALELPIVYRRIGCSQARRAAALEYVSSIFCRLLFNGFLHLHKTYMTSCASACDNFGTPFVPPKRLQYSMACILGSLREVSISNHTQLLILDLEHSHARKSDIRLNFSLTGKACRHASSHHARTPREHWHQALVAPNSRHATLALGHSTRWIIPGTLP